MVDGHDLLDQRGIRFDLRVTGEQAGGVGEQHQEVGAEQVRDQGGQPVVVAETNLVVGDGVVFVDDRDDTKAEKDRQGLAGVQVLVAMDEVEGSQQHLTTDQAVGGQSPVVVIDQMGLPHRRHRL